MTVKVDKTIVQMKIRSEAGSILDQMLGEELYRQSFISGDDAWTFRYTYAPTPALDIYPCNRFCGGTERRSHAFCTDLVL